MAGYAGMDGIAGKIAAFMVILVCSSVLIYINRDMLFGADQDDLAILPPELAACLQKRIGAVDKMRSDGVINDAQYEQFHGRAEAFCHAEFGEPVIPPT